MLVTATVVAVQLGGLAVLSRAYATALDLLPRPGALGQAAERLPPVRLRVAPPARASLLIASAPPSWVTVTAVLMATSSAPAGTFPWSQWVASDQRPEPPVHWRVPAATD